MGTEKTEALLRGDETVQLNSFEIDFQQRRVLCSDPEAVRYLERCLRENEPKRRELGTTYRLKLRFASGGELDVRTNWFEGGFSLCMPGDRPLEDGGNPRCGVVFRPPVPSSVKEMIDFLDSDSPRAKGTVLILEDGAIRREFDPSLRSP
jgi:hypothetical protein